jgi:hypothetical protein
MYVDNAFDMYAYYVDNAFDMYAYICRYTHLICMRTYVGMQMLILLCFYSCTYTETAAYEPTTQIFLLDIWESKP